MIKKVANNVYVVPYKKNASAVVSWGSDASETVDAIMDDKPNRSIDYIERPEGDRQLNNLHRLACENPSKWQLIFTKADFSAGRGLGVGQYEIVNNEEVLQPVIDPTFKTWFETHELNDLAAAAAMQLAYAEEFYCRIELDSVTKKLKRADIIDVHQIRARKLKKGETKISAFLVNPNFGTRKYKKTESIELAVFDPKDPTGNLVSVAVLRRPNIPGQNIYALAPWWGTKMWTSVSNKIPVYNDSGLDNGYFITHHISIPDDYFRDKNFETDEEEEAYKQSVMDAMEETVTGAENANKVVFTWHKADMAGREISGVKINPLKNNINDEAFVKLYNTASQAQAQGHGVPPALAGIETGGKLGGSGKELEASANYLQDFLSLEHRRLIEKCIRYLQKIDGLDLNKHVYIKRIKSYTYDVTATASTSNPNNPLNSNNNAN